MLRFFHTIRFNIWDGFLLLIWQLNWITLAGRPDQPVQRRRDLSATALNNRRQGGVSCHGDLGVSVPVMLVG